MIHIYQSGVLATYSTMQGTLFFSPPILLFRSQIAQIVLKPLTINILLKVHDIVHPKSYYCLHFSGVWKILGGIEKNYSAKNDDF